MMKASLHRLMSSSPFKGKKATFDPMASMNSMGDDDSLSAELMMIKGLLTASSDLLLAQSLRHELDADDDDEPDLLDKPKTNKVDEDADSYETKQTEQEEELSLESNHGDDDNDDYGGCHEESCSNLTVKQSNITASTTSSSSSSSTTSLNNNNKSSLTLPGDQQEKGLATRLPSRNSNNRRRNSMDSVSMSFRQSHTSSGNSGNPDSSAVLQAAQLIIDPRDMMLSASSHHHVLTVDNQQKKTKKIKGGSKANATRPTHNGKAVVTAVTTNETTQQQSMVVTQQPPPQQQHQQQLQEQPRKQGKAGRRHSSSNVPTFSTGQQQTPTQVAQSTATANASAANAAAAAATTPKAGGAATSSEKTATPSRSALAHHIPRQEVTGQKAQQQSAICTKNPSQKAKQQQQPHSEASVSLQPKKIIIVTKRGTESSTRLLSTQAGYQNLLSKLKVDSLQIEMDGELILVEDFESLVHGERYTLGSPIQSQQRSTVQQQQTRENAANVGPPVIIPPLRKSSSTQQQPSPSRNSIHGSSFASSGTASSVGTAESALISSGDISNQELSTTSNGLARQPSIRRNSIHTTTAPLATATARPTVTIDQTRSQHDNGIVAKNDKKKSNLENQGALRARRRHSTSYIPPALQGGNNTNSSPVLCQKESCLALRIRRCTTPNRLRGSTTSTGNSPNTSKENLGASTRHVVLRRRNSKNGAQSSSDEPVSEGDNKSTATAESAPASLQAQRVRPGRRRNSMGGTDSSSVDVKDDQVTNFSSSKAMKNKTTSASAQEEEVPPSTSHGEVTNGRLVAKRAIGAAARFHASVSPQSTFNLFGKAQERSMSLPKLDLPSPTDLEKDRLSRSKSSGDERNREFDLPQCATSTNDLPLRERGAPQMQRSSSRRISIGHPPSSCHEVREIAQDSQGSIAVCRKPSFRRSSIGALPSAEQRSLEESSKKRDPLQPVSKHEIRHALRTARKSSRDVPSSMLHNVLSDGSGCGSADKNVSPPSCSELSNGGSADRDEKSIASKSFNSEMHDCGNKTRDAKNSASTSVSSEVSHCGSKSAVSEASDDSITKSREKSISKNELRAALRIARGLPNRKPFP